MRAKVIISILARLNFVIGLTMIFPIGWAFYYNDSNIIYLVRALAATLIISGITALVFRSSKTELSRREGMAIVSLGWLFAGLFGALPFFLAKILGDFSIASFINCAFESISGFTTTGASVLGATIKIEDIGPGLLFWRSFTHWLGGMGIIILSIAILPLLGVGGMQLFKTEVPGSTNDKLKPRIKETAKTLWLVYIVLSAIETLLLMSGDMSLFDALCHTFGTMATGSFSTKTASIGAFNSTYIDVVIIVFMFLAGCNFALHYLSIIKGPKVYWKSGEFKFYVSVLILMTIVATTVLQLDGTYTTLPEALRYGAFQVVSITTTTGFATANFEYWPFIMQFILLSLMFFGGCAGSTGGSIKMIRIMMILKYTYRELYKLIHPKAFAAIKLEGKVVQKDILESIAGFFALFISIYAVATVIMTILGLDPVTAISSVAATIGNIGPGLGSVGPNDNYFHIPALGKVTLMLCMIVGRLEIYTVIVLFVPEFWKK